jgi:hypothetical protein
MPSTLEVRLLRWLCRIYGLMLLAYPSAFRREYSREMMVVFRTRGRDVAKNEGSWALLPFMGRVTWDWVHTTFQENASMTTRTHALRWFAAFPLAILAADAAQRIVGFFVRTDFQHIWIRADITMLLMAAAFVSIGVWVAPSRKGSIARIALSVVVFWGAVFIGGVALIQATTTSHFPGWKFTQWAADLSPGFCMLLGGVVAYLPWRHHDPSLALTR